MKTFLIILLLLILSTNYSYSQKKYKFDYDKKHKGESLYFNSEEEIIDAIDGWRLSVKNLKFEQFEAVEDNRHRGSTVINLGGDFGETDSIECDCFVTERYTKDKSKRLWIRSTKEVTELYNVNTSDYKVDGIIVISNKSKTGSIKVSCNIYSAYSADSDFEEYTDCYLTKEIESFFNFLDAKLKKATK